MTRLGIDQLDLDYGREGLRLLVQLLVELEVSAAIDAQPHERRPDRRAYRNGYRQRAWRSPFGTVMLYIPKLRKGAYYPSLLDRLPEIEPHLVTLLVEAYQGQVDGAYLEQWARQLNIDYSHPSQLADIAELLHDWVERQRSHLGQPVQTAISTRFIPLATRSGSPMALLKGGLAVWSDEAQQEWAAVMERVSKSLSGQIEAVAA